MEGRERKKRKEMKNNQRFFSDLEIVSSSSECCDRN